MEGKNFSFALTIPFDTCNLISLAILALEFWAYCSDEGSKTATKTLMNLNSRGRYTKKQREHQGEGRLYVGAEHGTSCVGY